MKYGITQWSYPGNGIYAMPFVAEAGFDGMEIELGGADDGYYLGEPKMQKLYMDEAKRLGLEFPSIVLNDLMYRGINGDKNGKDYKSAMYAQDLVVETAHNMDIDYIMLPFFYESDCTQPEGFERTVEYLKEICAKAKKYGIKIGAETPLNWDRQIELEEAVGADNLDTFFDTQNYMWFYELSQTENLEKLFPRMGDQLHLCDGTGTRANGGSNGGMLLGQGVADFEAQMDILRVNGFNGWLILENVYKAPDLYEMDDDAYTLAAKELQYVKDLVKKW